LAAEADLPRSTLVSQVYRRKFSVDVLVSVAHALEADVAAFLPPELSGHPPEDATVRARRALQTLESYLEARGSNPE